MAASQRARYELPRRAIDVSSTEPPALLVVVDTEEEFDWSVDFDRKATSVHAMRGIGKGQEVCEEFGIQPVYALDWPVASQPEGADPLREYARAGKAVLGAHLHPWVTPPQDEEVCAVNSYPGNLPRELEFEKLRRLRDLMTETFGEPPRIYKAGRYGFGVRTTEILVELGFQIDLSAAPPFDFGEDGGPDYSSFDARPYWFGEDGGLLGLPTTGAYVGFLGGAAHRTYGVARDPRLRWARLPGILSRLGAVDRLRLSPEGYDLSDLKKLTHFLLDRGVRTFTFSYHSPSLVPGHTSFVKDEADLGRFLELFRRYFDYFMNELGGVPSTPLELRDRYSRIDEAPQAP